MADLEQLLGAVLGAVQRELGTAPEVQPFVVLMDAQGGYGWRVLGKSPAQVTETLARIIQELASRQVQPRYLCGGCSELGHAHGTPPEPGWGWTPGGMLACPACRAKLCLDVPDRARPRLGAPAGAREPPDFPDGPVPLFLDEEEEEEMVLTDEQCRQLVANGQRTEDEMALERETKKLNEQERSGG